jgi:hypothetical protein
MRELLKELRPIAENELRCTCPEQCYRCDLLSRIDAVLAEKAEAELAAMKETK